MASGATGSRLGRILDPSFLEGLTDLPLEEVRQRRDEALAEREFQSYLRRLLQVRLDLLAREQERRRAGEPSQPLVERLTSLLAEGPQGPGRGEALRTVISEEDMAEAERRADAVVPETALASAESLSDEEIERALEGLRAEEHTISGDRSEVFRVHDALQEELKRRYREDPSQALRDR